MMFGSRIDSYIESARANGFSEQQIKLELLNAGWSASAIEKSLSKNTSEPPSSSSMTTVCQVPQRFITSKVTIIIFLLIATAFVAGIFLSERVWYAKKRDIASKDLLVRMTESNVGFVDTGELVFPDEQKILDSKRKYLNNRIAFIEADLNTMELSMYEDGELIKKFPIISKGKEGSWWETPTGDYRVLNKEPNHFSSIGKVWMPYSIQFYGNFFIHGWPYYENGEMVPTGHSGGCIRLATKDAKEVFEFTKKGTPILVKEITSPVKFGIATVKGGKPPVLTAKSFLVANISTGETLLKKTSDNAVPVASLTKLMTAVVASELVYLEKSIAVNNDMLASVVRFEPKSGEEYIAFDLLYPLLMQSSNKSANIIAGFLGREKFVEDMNLKSVSLGMNKTQFEDPSGIGNGNLSTNDDILKLLQYIYFKRSFIFQITKGSSYKTYSGVHIPELANYNEFVDDSRLVGIKNGKTTAAGETLASVWEFPSTNGVVPIAIILLGSKDRASDTKALLAWVETMVKFD